MQVSKRTIKYSSLVIAMAILLSAALMQLTYGEVQSANLSDNGHTTLGTLIITKTVEGNSPDTFWEYTIQGNGILSTVNVLPIGGSTAVSLPYGWYSVTETVKDGYWLKSSYYPYDLQNGAPNGFSALNPVDVYIGDVDATRHFVNSEFATITIVKDAIPDSSQPFTFSVSSSYYYTPTQFQLFDDGSGIGNSYVVTNGRANDWYYIDEYPVEGWAPLGVQCVDKDGPIIRPNSAQYAADLDVVRSFLPISRAFVPDIEAGGQYTCTFTNAAPETELLKTVGTEAGVCATTDEITVFPGTDVYYCYEVANTGGLTMTTHSLVDDQLSDILTDFPFDLTPGASIDTVAAGLNSPTELSVTTMNVATWTATMTYFPYLELVAAALDINASQEFDLAVPITFTAIATDAAKVNVIEPSKVVVDKVTLPSGSSQEFDFSFGPLEGTQETFSLTDQDTPWESDDLFPGAYAVTEVPVSGWALTSVTCTDDAGAPYPPDDINLLPGVTVTCTFNNLQFDPSVSVLKTVGTDADACGTSQNLEVDAGTEVYFCFTLENTGNVTLTEHTLIDTQLGLTATFSYDLTPGEVVEVTNAVLESLGQPTLLGPVTVDENTVNTVVFQASDGEEVVEDRSSAEVVLRPTNLDDDEFPTNNRLFLPHIR